MYVKSAFPGNWFLFSTAWESITGVFPRSPWIADFLSQKGCSREKQTANGLCSSTRMKQHHVSILAFSWLLYGDLFMLFYSSMWFCLFFPNSNTGDIKRWEIYFRTQSVLNVMNSANEYILGQRAAITSAGKIHLTVRWWREGVWCFVKQGQVAPVFRVTEEGIKLSSYLPCCSGCSQQEAACPAARVWKITRSTANWWCLNLSSSSWTSYSVLAKMHFLKRPCCVYFP